MHVREGRPADLAAIVEFIAAEASEAEGLDLDRTTLAKGVGEGLQDSQVAEYWLLVDDADEAVGCTSVVKEWSDWNAGYYWWIQSMFIEASHRGTGYADLLVDAVLAAAKARDCIDLRLYVHKGNAAAIRAYEKLGFTETRYAIMSRKV